MKTRAPYGSWSSPLAIDDIAGVGEVGFRYGGLDIDADGVFWIEARPAEGGRSVVVWRPRAGDAVDATPAGFNVRSRVHEYGGGALFRHGATLFFSNFEDGRLYRQDGVGARPQPITPEPPAPNALRYADGTLTPDGTLIVCVRERHQEDAVLNELVAIRADGAGEPRAISTGNDFYAAPRISPDGDRLAWLTWNDPLMPFDGCELWVADLDAEVTPDGARLVAGGPRESVFQPEWSPGGDLHFTSDRTGWWNLYRARDGALEPLAPMEAEVGVPQWLLGSSRYAFLDDGRIACVATRNGISRLGLVDAAGAYEELDLPYTYYAPFLRSHGSRIACVAASPTDAPAVLEVDVADGSATRIGGASVPALDEASIARPEPIEFPTRDGATAHGFFYAPRNARFAGDDGELPPLRVFCHGGPTSQSPAMLMPTIQFWTTRGYAVVDVNYGGSTGYGRAYRDRLRGRWGEVDVDDCIAAGTYLADSGLVDRSRMAISGGSAGGYTTLCALAFHDVFAAGINAYGVVDLETFRETTHKFEAHYDHYLVGPWPERADLYRARSPIHAADRIAAPLLVLQGLEDAVVPPSQADQLVAALDRNGVPYAYLAFEGEGHGFRREETIRRTLGASVAFLARVFGVEPADELEPLELTNADALTSAR